MILLLCALLLTIAAEGIVCLVFPLGGADRKAALLSGLAGNLLTNPLLNLLLLFLYGTRAYLPVLVVGELAAFFCEAAIYRKAGGLNFPRAFLLSLTANLLSFGAGMLLL